MVDERHCRQLAVDKAWLTEATKWAGIKTVVCVERRRIEQDRESRETAYYISSLTADVTELARSIRGHWEVENKAHWVLDVVYKEDECAVTDEWVGSGEFGGAASFILEFGSVTSEEGKYAK